MNDHNEFRYVPEPEVRETSHGPLPIPPEGKALLKPNQIARTAASAAYRIRCTEIDPRNWGALIAAEPEEIRECLRQYLAQAYRAMQRRDRDKRSAAGDAELAKMGELARRL